MSATAASLAGAAKSRPGHVLVVGSLNADLIVRAPRLPRPGETLLGGSFHVVAGGKGANQAVAAARMGALVRMVGRVGADAFGRLLRDELERAGVGIEHLQVDPEAATGTAHIAVGADGQNAIIVACGANQHVGAADVVAVDSAWDGAELLVMQLEIPLATVVASAGAAAARGVPVLLNAAPICPLPDELLAALTWLVVNEVEAEELLGRPVRCVADGLEAARALRRPGRRVVVTLGAAGAVMAGDGPVEHLPAPQVRVVDTTAAGDAFVGALAAGLQRGLGATDAAADAVVAASLACTRLGAIPSLPTLGEVRRHRDCDWRS